MRSERGPECVGPAAAPWRGRIATAGLSAAAVVACLMAAPRTGRGQDPGEKPGTEVLRSAPFDRITLTDGTVLVVEPISPRPLPVYDVAKEVKSKQAFKPPAEGNVFLPGERARLGLPPEKEKPKEGANEVSLHLLQRAEIRDFKVKRAFIRRVEYFEDMLLAEADRRVLAHDFAGAFECCLRVQMRQPGWAGLDEHVNRVLFEEGSVALLDGEGEHGLRLLRELFVRAPDYPGLADKLAAAYGSRAVRAFDLGLYAKGRTILHDLEPLVPNHPVVRETRARFIARADHLVEEAGRCEGAERLDLLVEALRVWPAAEGASARFAEAFAAEPTLDVAVVDLPRAVGPWVRCPADDRISRLLYEPILARDDEEASRGGVAGQLLAALESSDLGHKLVLRLRTDVPWSDGSRPASAIDVARALTDRAEPSSPQYCARWADLLDRVDTPDESRVEVRLTRASLRPASWFVFPVGPAHAGRDGRVVVSDASRLLVGDGPFRWDAARGEQVWLRAAATAKGPRVRRIHEVRLANAKATLGALIRGEVSLVEHVPADRVAGLSAHPDIKVGRFNRPALHRIALDGRNPVLRNRTLRRGLSYAIDRRTLLEETLLKRPPDPLETVADGPFERGSYADALGVEPLGYDPLLAKMLVAAARREIGSGPITLTLDYPSRPEAQAVVPKLVESFGLVGVAVVARERPETELETELRAGRRFDLAYRVSCCSEPVLEAGGLICPGYDAPPAADALAAVASPRILQLLLQLERTPEWPSAKGTVVQIDRECRDELPVLPLWQLVDHYAWRTRLKGPAAASDSLYQDIHAWEIEPWYARDPW